MWNSPDIEYNGTGVRTKCRASALFFVEEPRQAKLQQEFVDLRFGMFNHFNLATFQDREWGDPHDPPMSCGRTQRFSSARINLQGLLRPEALAGNSCSI